MAASLIISIWRVDPVGGEYVDWPADDDHADAGSPHLWDSDAIAASAPRYFSQLANANADALWVRHNELQDFRDECRTLRDSARSICRITGHSRDAFRQHLDNLINAVRFAESIDDAGVYVG